MDFHLQASAVRGGTVTVPGDKSISHRALMLGSLAEGTSSITGFLAGEDCLSTLQALRDLGVRIEQHDATSLTVHGVGLRGLNAPRGDLDMGNSGTAMRLFCGVLAGQGFDSRLVGDESLSGRPMNRVILPLAAMGARIESQDGKPPLSVHGQASLRGIDYEMPVASAQVKSCVLLAGLYAEQPTSVFEPAVTRDHTERMFGTMGVEVTATEGWIGIEPGQTLTATDIEVPGDLSSAAFIILAVLLAESAEASITGVGINPTRTGVIDILRAMGADISLENPRELGREPVADLRVRSSRLRGIEVDPALVSLAIDEFPVLFVAAAAAQGRTVFTGIGELRVKESDRIGAMAAGLRTLGVLVDESPDGAIVHGGAFTGGEIQCFSDHRIAMAFAVAGTIASADVVIRNVDAVDTSFPGFADLLSRLGARISVRVGEPST